MTPSTEALARRAVACRSWRWMGGMRWVSEFAGGQSLADRAGRILTEWDAADDGGRVFRLGHRAMLPDLTDPATLGCLLALVREAWGDPLIHATPQPRQFGSGRETIRWRVRRIEIEAATEAEALIAALEAEP